MDEKRRKSTDVFRLPPRSFEYSHGLHPLLPYRPSTKRLVFPHPASEPEPSGHCLTGAQRPEKCLFAEAGGKAQSNIRTQ